MIEQCPGNWNGPGGCLIFQSSVSKNLSYMAKDIWLNVFKLTIGKPYEFSEKSLFYKNMQ